MGFKPTTLCSLGERSTNCTYSRHSHKLTCTYVQYTHVHVVYIYKTTMQHVYYLPMYYNTNSRIIVRVKFMHQAFTDACTFTQTPYIYFSLQNMRSHNNFLPQQIHTLLEPFRSLSTVALLIPSMYKIGPIQADLVMRGLPDVEQFSPEWEDAVVISPDHAQPADSQRLG